MSKPYRSVLSTWHRRSAVRAKPRRVRDGGATAADGGGLMFRPDLVPAAAHPALVRQGPEVCERMLALHLLRYLHYTDVLELEVVNPVLAGLIRGDLGLPMPDEMLLDAHRIYTDEGYHAQMSIDLRLQVQDGLGGSAPAPRRPAGLDGILAATDGADPADRVLARTLAAVVSETLVSANLQQADDPRLDPAVRALIADHAEDERAHHAYFARLFRLIWPQLDDAARDRVGVLLPGFVVGFLAPDPGALAADLAWLGLDGATAATVIADCRADRTDPATARAAAASTLALFGRTGVFDRPAVAAAFAEAALLADVADAAE